MTRTIICLFLIGLIACQTTEQSDVATTEEFNLEFQKFELENGLEVVFHIDRSDPVVAVALTSHVGSAREKAGRTGFAHLFEHLLFLESENLGKGGLDKMSARIGGSGANGFTSRDITNYFQTVPNDALEKMIWAEADKLGWFINTVTDPVLAKEKQVVKNEKRERVDNQPYGNTQYVIDKALYPEDHPYNWQVIGSLEDLQNATLADVKEFFRTWYVPNNVTLTISGDFDPVQAKEWVQKYFDEIPPGDEITNLEKRPGTVQETLKFVHEDNFARLPELTLVWPSVPLYHPDSYALNVLTEYLSDGKLAPFTKTLVDDKQLTSNVRIFNYASELAGQIQLRIRAFEGTSLDTVLASVNDAFASFEANGITEKDVARINAGQKTNFYDEVSSVLGKAFLISQYNSVLGDPGYINEEIQFIQNVTPEDVQSVYEKYIKGKSYIATSFVPKGTQELALAGSQMADIVEEAIAQGAEENFDPSLAATYEKTPSTFDRSVEPPYGPAPSIQAPEVWNATLENGLSIYGIETNEVPLVQMSMSIEGGQLLDEPAKVGVANMLAQMMTRGTKSKTPAELEEAIAQLGGDISVRANKQSIRIYTSVLASEYPEFIKLLQEVLLEPRWDKKEFELVKQSTLSSLNQQSVNPFSIASNTFNILIYGEENVLSKNILGDEKSIENITLDDLITYYESNILPNITRLCVVGSIGEESTVESLGELEANWQSADIDIPKPALAPVPDASTVYFYDVPDAKQSMLMIGYPAMAETDPDYYPSVIMNYRLGGGGFASQLTQTLREGKGYTYGIRSGFRGSDMAGPFTISSGVRSNVTLESTQEIKQILENYAANYDSTDLETTKSALVKGNARAFETAGAKLNMLEKIGEYGWSTNYINDREEIINTITVDQIQELAGKYINPNNMYWLIVGDAKTQLERMNELGYGAPVLINEAAGPEN